MDTEALRTLVLITGIAVLSPFISDVAKRWTRLPGVVIEIGLGILIGPYVLGLVEIDEVIGFMAELGLVFLIFLAGFEVDPDVVKGRPVKLAVGGWMISLVVAIAVATALYALDITSAIRFVAICLTTTAIGTLLPILGDAGILPTRLGTNILASGAMGEIGPIIAISLALSSDRPGRTTAVLLAFGAIAALVTWLATRPARPRTVMLIARTLHSSGQLGVRICLLLCMLLVWVADEFSLDILLGAFAAGMVARLFLMGHSDGETESMHNYRAEVQHGIEALGFGFFIPLFFIVSGVKFDLDALLDPIEILKVPMFLGLMLLARGASRAALPARSRPERRRGARPAAVGGPAADRRDHHHRGADRTDASRQRRGPGWSGVAVGGDLPDPRDVGPCEGPVIRGARSGPTAPRSAASSGTESPAATGASGGEALGHRCRLALRHAQPFDVGPTIRVAREQRAAGACRRIRRW